MQFSVISGPFYCKFMVIIGSKSPGIVLLRFGGMNFSICLWGNSKTLHFYDLGISGRVLGFQNQYYMFFETPGYLKKSCEIPGGPAPGSLLAMSHEPLSIDSRLINEIFDYSL